MWRCVFVCLKKYHINQLASDFHQFLTMIKWFRVYEGFDFFEPSTSGQMNAFKENEVH